MWSNILQLKKHIPIMELQGWGKNAPGILLAVPRDKHISGII